jgi:hypothetical protein
LIAEFAGSLPGALAVDIHARLKVVPMQCLPQADLGARRDNLRFE